jgi:hypothetical protein
VLTSKTILKNVFLVLGVENEVYVKEGLRYTDAYPDQPIVATLPASFKDQIKGMVELRVSPSRNGFKVKF